MVEYNEMDLAKDQTNAQFANDPNSQYAGAMREEKAATLLDQINPDNVLSDIENRIRGKVKDKLTGEWKEVEGMEPVSNAMVSNFISFLGSIFHQGTTMSNYTSVEINNIMDKLKDYIVHDISVNADKYGLKKDYALRTKICHMMCHNCLTVFKRGLNGSESRKIFSVIKMTESISGGNKKGGLMESFKFW